MPLQKREKNKTLTAPDAPTRSGYTFKGWFTDPACEHAYDFNTKVTESFTLYAKWEGKKTAYRVAHWKQNANDNGYTFVEMETRTDNAGLAASYTAKKYDGFTLNATRSNTVVPIKGDGTTIKNVYYEEVFFRKIREEARQLLMTVSELEVFSPSIAEELSEGKNVHDIIDYCEKVGSFLTRVGPDTWEIIGDVREFLKWKKALLWSIEQRIENNRRIAAWYEKNDRLAEAAEYYEKVGDSQKILGRHGKGLVDVGVAEVGFECGTMEPHEVIRLANRGIAEAANTGSSEICFAGYGVVIRQNLAQGNLRLARDCLEQFRERVEREDDTQLIPNIKATDALIALYESDQDKVMKWIGETPDVHHNFSILDRYIYQIRLQCLIAIDSLPEAMNLASYMDWYYREYRRTYSRIENGILNGIIAYRQGHSDWSQILADALSAAEEYHYVQVAAMKGGALMPLLNEMETSQVPEKFLKEVKSRCREIALAYPDFMKRASRERPQLTPREEEILGMLCAGESMDKICETCGISYSGLKKHNRNIYAKLGAQNRAEAERAAVSMGLVRRGSSSD